MSPSEENQKFKPIPNPYITGNPVREKNVFFGREDDFAYVRQRLLAEKDGIVMLFVGARRSGKTSIMVQILDGRLGEEFLPVFVDMQRFSGDTGDRDFFRRLAEIVVQEGIKDERLALEYYDFSEGNPVIPFDRLLEDIQRLFPDKRMIFLVDEAEILQSKVDQGDLSPNVLTYMASILESRKISFCFTGSPGLGETQGTEWRRLSGKGEAREISFLSPEDTTRLAQLPVEGHLEYADGVFDEIYNLTYGQPFYTQVICTNVVDFLNGAMRNRLEKEDLEEVVRTIVDNPPPQLIYEWDNLSPQEMITISLLSEESQGPGMGITSEELAEAIRENDYPLTMKADAIHIALESLYNTKWLERDEEGAYHIRVDLFRQWIKRARSIWRLVEDQEPKSKKKLWGVLAAGGLVVVAVVVALWATRASEIEDLQRQQIAAASATQVMGDVWVDADLREVKVEIRHLETDSLVQVNERAPMISPELEPGSYLVKILHPKYHVWSDTATVVAGKTDSLHGKLKRLTGFLEIESQPTGAQVVMQGERDTTILSPIRGLELPTGEYQITVRKPGFVGKNIDVTIENGITHTQIIDLAARVGNLFVDSDPPAAEVFLDNKRISANTPYLFIGIDVGNHRIKLVLNDYQEYEQTIVTALGKTDSIFKKLTLLHAVMDLVSDPIGASVYLNDSTESSGETPLPLMLEPGTYRLRIELEGHDPVEIERELGPDERGEERVTFNVQYGTVRIIKPIFQTVVIDGKEEKPTQPAFKLPVGSHELTIKGTEMSKKIYVEKDSVKILSIP
ncbi:MAG: PEGA domain-containing protein [Gemmatimonadetes bacterium]|nr:PEGA domain-containing protein [Gemmatimonadota bacterium]